LTRGEFLLAPACRDAAATGSRRVSHGSRLSVDQ
jgi:hypothetical protein